MEFILKTLAAGSNLRDLVVLVIVLLLLLDKIFNFILAFTKKRSGKWVDLEAMAAQVNGLHKWHGVDNPDGDNARMITKNIDRALANLAEIAEKQTDALHGIVTEQKLQGLGIDKIEVSLVRLGDHR